MVLKRKEEKNIIKAMYDSSNILASIYNRDTNDLTLIFNKGTQYKYPNVTMTDYTRFELAESQGKVFNSHIKQYVFEKLEEIIDPATFINEIQTLKEAENEALIKAKQLQLISKMSGLLVGVDTANLKLFTEEQLKPLQEAITNYLTELKK